MSFAKQGVLLTTVHSSVGTCDMCDSGAHMHVRLLSAVAPSSKCDEYVLVLSFSEVAVCRPCMEHSGAAQCFPPGTDKTSFA